MGERTVGGQWADPRPRSPRSSGRSPSDDNQATVGLTPSQFYEPRQGRALRVQAPQAARTHDAAKSRSPYLPATRPHLVWRLFGHAAADPGHARHLAAAVHGLLRSDTFLLDLDPAGVESRSRPSDKRRTTPGQSTGAGHWLQGRRRPRLTSLSGAECETGRGGERVGSGSRARRIHVG